MHICSTFIDTIICIYNTTDLVLYIKHVRACLHYSRRTGPAPLQHRDLQPNPKISNLVIIQVIIKFSPKKKNPN